MKLHILSDLHIEFGMFDPPPTEADVVVLAGDIGVGLGGLEWIESHFKDKPVIYVPGNHEYYHHDVRLVEQLKAEAPANVHVLNNDAVEIEGVRFLGCVLWVDFEIEGVEKKQAAMALGRQRMSDFRFIQNQNRAFTPEDAVALHKESRVWLAQNLADPFDGKTVVVTHHMPSPKSIPARFVGSPFTPAFVSNLEDLVLSDHMTLWVHGHTHDAFDYKLNGVRVVCNPRGYYPHELTAEFRADLLVKV